MAVGTQREFVFQKNQQDIYPEFSHIEIWENTGDLTNPNYNGILLNNDDHHNFTQYDYGEIIRINHDQCEFNP